MLRVGTGDSPVLREQVARAQHDACAAASIDHHPRRPKSQRSVTGVVDFPRADQIK